MPASQPRFRRYLLLGLLVATILLASGAIAGSANSHVTLTVDDSTPVSTDTVDFEGETYEIDAITVRDPGDDFTAQVTLPDEEFTDIAFLLYNSDQQIEASERINRPGTEETATFEMDSFAPGTYMLNVELEGATERMQPIVIAGYDVTVDHTEAATREDNLEVTADVTPTSLSASPAGVEVVVWNDTHSQTFEMTHSGDETYTSSIALDQFNTGEYTVNVAALGDETFRGQQEVLALEDSSLTIQETTRDDGTDGSDSGGNDGQGSDDSTSNGSGYEEDSASGDDESSETDNTTDTENTASDTDNTTTDDDVDGSETDESSGSDAMDSEDSDDDVISPNQNTSSESTDDQASLFAVQGVLLLLLVVISIRRVRD